MRLIPTLALLMVAAAPAVAAEGPGPGSDAALASAFEATIAEASAAIQEFGVTDSAMMRIQSALARLATQPSLRNPAKLQQIHGSPKSNAAVLASRGDDGLTLFLTRFEPGHATPVHDHQTWGVVHVIEGRDHYVHWDVDYPDGDHGRADVRKATGVVLVPGASVYWFPPPHDLHSQEALDGVVWELVLAGKNFLAASVLGHRHYFDPKTGGVTHMPQK